jgi:hypothetical protein
MNAEPKERDRGDGEVPLLLPAVRPDGALLAFLRPGRVN